MFDGHKCDKTAKWESEQAAVATLSNKWTEVPATREEYRGADIVVTRADPTQDRADTLAMANWTDERVFHFWKGAAPWDTFTLFYASIFRGKQVAEASHTVPTAHTQWAWHRRGTLHVSCEPSLFYHEYTWALCVRQARAGYRIRHGPTDAAVRT